MPKRKKRRDFSYTDPSGVQWDSRFEYVVFDRLRSLGYGVRKCTESDSFVYHTEVRQGRCMECSSSNVVQVRTYTPDLYVDYDPTEARSTARLGFYIECKGYFPAEKRSLLRAVSACTEGADIRVLFAKLARLTPARSNVEYTNKIIRMPAGILTEKGVQWYGRQEVTGA